MSSTRVVSLVGVLALATLHVIAGHLRGHARERPTWLIAASGMAMAYVFIHLLPEMAEEQNRWLAARADRRLHWLHTQIYLFALLGVIASIALDRRAHRRGSRGFSIHIGSFALYNALIGGFAQRLTDVVSMVLAVLAFGAHFLLTDHRLKERYGRAHERIGRWVLAAAILLGWLIALVWKPPVVVVAGMVGLLSGGIVVNVINEELPERDTGRLSPWVAGALSYAALLLVLTYSEAL